jgi:hypothetical protein
VQLPVTQHYRNPRRRHAQKMVVVDRRRPFFPLTVAGERSVAVGCSSTKPIFIQCERICKHYGIRIGPSQLLVRRDLVNGPMSFYALQGINFGIAKRAGRCG